MNARLQRDLGVAAIVVGALLVALAGAAAISIAGGFYAIGADEPHTRAVALLLEQLRDRSIARQARAVVVPDLDVPAMIGEGAEHYAAMCAGCHLAPGVTESEIRPGLNPAPPNLVTEGIDDPREGFWVIKHGIKMSGMPAWGRTHDDESIWNIVAFVRQMPKMSAATYRALAGANAAEAAEAADRD